MHNTQLAQVIAYAWHLSNLAWELAVNYRLPDGWNWYDIEATAPGSPGEDDLRLMFQVLLEDRFRLKVHQETRDMPVYDLVVGSGGSKLKAAMADSRIEVDGRPIASGKGIVASGLDGLHLMGKGATTGQLASSLSGRLGSPVHDRTGMSGVFDYNVVFARDDNPADVSGLPTLAVALQQELGLRLEKSKAQVEVLIVDHVEKPSEN